MKASAFEVTFIYKKHIMQTGTSLQAGHEINLLQLSSYGIKLASDHVNPLIVQSRVHKEHKVLNHESLVVQKLHGLAGIGFNSFVTWRLAKDYCLHSICSI